MKKILIFLFVLTAFISESTAVDWNFYGKFGSGIWWMKSHRFYDDTIFFKEGIVIVDTALHQTDPFPVNVSDFLTYGTFGLKVKGDRFKSVVELGIHYNAFDSKAGDEGEQFYYKKFNNLASFNKWYFEWYFNDYLSILAGQDYAPTNFFPSSQAFYGENSFANIGCMYTGKSPMIQFSVHHPDDKWKAKFAVARVDTTNFQIRNKYIDASVEEDTVYYYAEVRVPKLEGSFEFNLEGESVGFECKVAGGFQRYYQLGMHHSHYDTTTCKWFENGWEKYPVDAYLMGANFGLKLGMFKLSLVGFGGQNVGVYGAYIGDAFGWWFDAKYMLNLMPIFTDTVPDEYLNSKLFEIAAILSLKPTDNLAFEGGVGTVGGFLPGIFGGWTEHEEETYTREWDPTYAWYFNTQYKILERLAIKPEVGQYYYGPLFGFGKYTYWGFSTFIEF